MAQLKKHIGRRGFLALSAVSGLAGMHASESEAAVKDAGEFKALDEGDRIDAGGNREEIVQKARDLGAAYVKKFSSCSRGTVAALEEAIPFVPEDDMLIRAASCLDGGATPTKMASCGAFTGCGMIIGYVCGKGTPEETSFSHVLMNELHGKFTEKFGSVLCRDIRESAEKNCADVVGSASGWAAEIILKHFTA